MSSISCLDGVKSLTFDLMGTCADWRSALLQHISNSKALPDHLDKEELIAEWRAGYFDMIFDLHERDEDMDVSVDEVHAAVLDQLLEKRGVSKEEYGPEDRKGLVYAWHKQVAWPDSVEGISRFKKKYDCVVVANGTTRLQLDIISSANLPFHALFSSQLLGHTKPDSKAYTRALELLDRRPEEVAMVAAHAYDLRAAKKLGFKTIYIRRDTEDPMEDFDAIKNEFDVYIDGRDTTGSQGGLIELAHILGV